MALDFFAGSVAGAAGVLAGHPLDTVKVRLQTQTETGPNAKYRGLFSCIRLMVKEEGFWSLYKGITSPLVGLAAVNAIIFGVQGATLRYPNLFSCIRLMVKEEGFWSLYKGITSPLVGLAAVNAIIFGVQGATLRYPNLFSCIRLMVKEEGFWSLYKGITSPLVGLAAVNAIIFGVQGATLRYPNLFSCIRLMVKEEGFWSLYKGITSTLVGLAAVNAIIFGVQGATLRYPNLFSCIRLMVKEEGFWSLYKGITSPLVGLAAVNAIIFGVQGATLRALPGQEPRHHFVAGSVAGLAQSFVTSPMELVKTRLQVQGLGQPDKSAFSTRSQVDVYRGPMDCFRQIYRQGGVAGLCRGLGPTLARDAPAFGLYFYSYELITKALDPKGAANLPAPHLLFAGGMAGVVSWIGTYPQDVVKSRLQADGVYAHSREYSGALDCLRKTVRNDGAKAFTQGLGSAIARAFVLNAVTFYVVEWVFRLHQRFEEEQAVVGSATQRLLRPTPSHWDRYHHHFPLPEAGTTFLPTHVYNGGFEQPM